MPMFCQKSFGRFYYRFVLETPNITSIVYILYISRKSGLKKKNDFFLPTFVYLNGYSLSVSQQNNETNKLKNLKIS